MVDRISLENLHNNGHVHVVLNWKVFMSTLFKICNITYWWVNILFKQSHSLSYVQKEQPVLTIDNWGVHYNAHHIMVRHGFIQNEPSNTETQNRNILVDAIIFYIKNGKKKMLTQQEQRIASF